MKTSITVVEKISTEAPASVSVIEDKEILRMPGANIDDRLRNVPGFTLFRRSSSTVAHPTTQGVSMRGIGGASGASRTLLLWDGIPLNDPFGGWVYWDRLPPGDLGRIEVSRGASTSIFGDRAMGGAIALFSREPEKYRLSSSYEAGNRGTHEASADFSNLWTRWAASAGARAFTTDGYFIVPGEVRGAVDERAGLDFIAANSKLDYLGGAQRVFLKFDLLGEQRRNGTTLQRNSTGLGAIAAHYARELQRDGFSLRAYHTREEFRSTFSSIAPDRDSERLTLRQTVPAESVGGAALWRHDGTAIRWLAGGDVLRVEGYSKEALVPTGRRVGGGTMLQHGVFAQADAAAGPARFFLGARHDFTARDDTFFSPSAGFVLGRGRVRGRGSVYRSFRSPTLNELYREFRAGNAVTQANAALRPETLFGAEAGLDVIGESRRLGLTVYRNSLHDLITNVTLSSAPNLIVRQRQNAASALSRGAELDARQRWGPVSARVSYLYVDSRFGSGVRVPQVPRHQGSAQLDYTPEGTVVSLGIRSFGPQFEDEQNQFRLAGFASVQLMVSRRLAHGLSAVAAIENALDHEYFTGFTPTPNIGPPRLWRAGLRWASRVR